MKYSPRGKVVINSLKSAKNYIKQFYTRKKYCQNRPNVREKPPNRRKPEKSGDKCLKKRNKKNQAIFTREKNTVKIVQTSERSPQAGENQRKVVINALKIATNDIKQFYMRKKYCQNRPNVKKKPSSRRKPEKSDKELRDPMHK